MLDSEKFAIAAHLHVLLRRTNGRVTDVEWMIRSPEYALEIIKVARAEPHPDLHKLADKMEAVVRQSMPVQRAARPVPAPDSTGFAASDSGEASRFASSDFTSSRPGQAVTRKRYVGTLR